jgi:glycine/D-amino acid oxidase-like deaminating enzyme
MSYDHLIIGAGLAGSLLARDLVQRGKRVLVVHDAGIPGASRISAGLLNPITGRRHAPAWKLSRFLPFARQSYRELQREFSIALFQERTITRFFQDEQDRDAWQKRMNDPVVQTHSKAAAGNEWNQLPVHSSFGAVTITGGGVLRTGLLLDGLHAMIRERATMVEGRCEQGVIQIPGEAPCPVSDLSPSVSYCEGHAVLDNPAFASLPFEFSQGDILVIRAPAFPDACVVCRGIYLVPAGNGMFRAGASYDWSSRDPSPTAAGRAWIESRLREFMKVSFEITDHFAGVRLTTRRRHPVVGRHPDDNAVSILNGLGSKGVLYAPGCARQLAELLVQGTPVESGLDPQTHSR